MNKYISQAKYTNQLHQIVYRMATLRIIHMSSLFECKYALVMRVHIDYKVNYRSRIWWAALWREWKANCAQVSGVTLTASGDITAMMPRVQQWHVPSAQQALRFKRRLQRARSSAAALAPLSLPAPRRTWPRSISPFTPSDSGRQWPRRKTGISALPGNRTAVPWRKRRRWRMFLTTPTERKTDPSLRGGWFGGISYWWASCTSARFTDWYCCPPPPV